VVSLALKPTSSITLPAKPSTSRASRSRVVTTGRHDPLRLYSRDSRSPKPCWRLVLMDHCLRFRAQCGRRGFSPTPVITSADERATRQSCVLRVGLAFRA